ncbi:MAG: ComEC/Rec2 family competence protein, partial [Candidatus Zixiibacteriota bacterium]
MGRKYPALVSLAFVVAGIVVADLTHLPSGLFLLLALAAILCSSLVIYRNQGWFFGLVGLALFGISGYHFAIDCYDLTPRHIARVIDESRTVQIFGTVSDWPELKANLTEIVIEVDSLGGEVQAGVEGALLLKVTDTTTALQRGDRVEFYGRIYPEVGGENGGERFDYRRHLHLRGLFGVVYLPTLLDVRIDRRYQFGLFALVDQLRDAIRSIFYEYLSPDAAALAAGFLIGETRNIPVEVYQWFRDSGTLHLLAVSGSNVALVLLVIIFVLRPFGFSNKARSIVLLISIVCFAMLSYGEPSVLRASIMAALVILGRGLKRRYDLNHIVAVAMLIILLWSPAQLYDIGFQLSFVTAWGLVFFVPRVAALFEGFHNRRWYRYIAFPLIISLVAQICSTPLTAYYFGRVPVWSLAANLVVVPMVSLDVLGIMALLFATAIAPTLGLAAGSLLDPLMHWTIDLVRLFGASSQSLGSFSSLRGSDWGWGAIVAFYCLIVLAGFALAKRWARRTVVILFLSVTVFGLTVATANHWTPQHEQLVVTRVPGGVAGIRYFPGSGNADIIVTGLAEKEYPVDERVFGPLLKSKGIAKVQKLIILGASFGALDDLVRFGQSYRADSVYVPVLLKHSFKDALVLSGLDSTRGVTVAYFGSGIQDSVRPGYYLSTGSVLLRMQGSEYLFIRSGDVKEIQLRSRAGETVITGGSFGPSASEWE